MVVTQVSQAEIDYAKQLKKIIRGAPPPYEDVTTFSAAYTGFLQALEQVADQHEGISSGLLSDVAHVREVVVDLGRCHGLPGSTFWIKKHASTSPYPSLSLLLSVGLLAPFGPDLVPVFIFFCLSLVSRLPSISLVRFSFAQFLSIAYTFIHPPLSFLLCPLFFFLFLLIPLRERPSLILCDFRSSAIETAAQEQDTGARHLAGGGSQSQRQS